MNRLRIAIIGKGGAGKSTISGTLARLLARRGQPVLALDSDPMPGLSLSLGLGPIDDAMLAEAAERGEDGRYRLKSGIGPARAVSRFSVCAPDGVRFLQFGKTGEDGLRTIMPSVGAFGQMVNQLARDRVMREWSVIGDLSAGTRQTAFDWAPYASAYLVVVEPTWTSVLTARRLQLLAEKRSPEHVWIVANKMDSDDDFRWIADRMEAYPRASLPADVSVGDADRRGRALIDCHPESPVVVAVEALLDDLIETMTR